LAIALPASSRAASDRGQPEAAPHWAGQALQDAMRGMPNGTAPTEPAPAVIPELEKFHNPEGFAANYQPAGATPTRGQPFFVPLGTNGRTCQTCHQPSAGWSITPRRIQAAFRASGGNAPLFRPVDGAVCPSADTSTYQARIAAYGLVLNKGLIRV